MSGTWRSSGQSQNTCRMPMSRADLMPSSMALVADTRPRVPAQADVGLPTFGLQTSRRREFAVMTGGWFSAGPTADSAKGVPADPAKDDYGSDTAPLTRVASHPKKPIGPVISTAYTLCRPRERPSVSSKHLAPITASKLAPCPMRRTILIASGTHAFAIEQPPSRSPSLARSRSSKVVDLSYRPLQSVQFARY